MKHTGPIKVIISDPESGEVLESKIIHNDYVLITAGNRYLKSMQIWGRTHQLNVAVADTIKEKDNVSETD